MDDFSPINQLESVLLDAKQGLVPIEEFIRQFWFSEIALPTASEVGANGSGFTPILFDKRGVSMLAAFTAKERIGQLAEKANFCMVMKGSELLLRMPKAYGLVVNPGHKVGFDISPSGISQIVSEYR